MGQTNIADLEKLAELKEKGILIEEEFARQKKAILRNKKMSWLVNLLIIIFAVFFLVKGIEKSVDQSDLDTNGMPKCDSKLAKNSVRDAILNSPYGRSGLVELIELKNATTVFSNAEGKVCSAEILLSNGMRFDDFSFRKTDTGYTIHFPAQ